MSGHHLSGLQEICSIFKDFLKVKHDRRKCCNHYEGLAYIPPTRAQVKTEDRVGVFFIKQAWKKWWRLWERADQESHMLPGVLVGPCVNHGEKFVSTSVSHREGTACMPVMGLQETSVASWEGIKTKFICLCRRDKILHWGRCWSNN